jgi:hypothetical protein
MPQQQQQQQQVLQEGVVQEAGAATARAYGDVVMEDAVSDR